MIKRNIYLICTFIIYVCSVNTPIIFAQTINASTLLQKTVLYLSPQSGSFLEGSTFEVSIFINTYNRSINSVDLKVNFDPRMLEIVNPSSGQSIIGVWVEPPAFDNTKGYASYIGVIPNGLVTNSGLIGSITFKAKKSGKTEVKINSASSVLINNGEGTESSLEVGRANYVITPKPPLGIEVFSETHPISSQWYNNKNPIISWRSDESIDGFSYVLDNKPFTIPENNITTNTSSVSFNDLDDGLYYFHIKPKKRGVWGNATHFLFKIDTTPPAQFSPKASYIFSENSLIERSLISFTSTDNLSGIDYYEIGIIDKKQPLTTSPVFVGAKSPFQLPLIEKADFEVIVRAVDMSGNVTDSSTRVRPPFFILQFFKDHLVLILLAIIALFLTGIIVHYLIGHHIIRYMKRAFSIIKTEEEKDENMFNANKIDDSNLD